MIRKGVGQWSMRGGEGGHRSPKVEPSDLWGKKDGRAKAEKMESQRQKTAKWH